MSKNVRTHVLIGAAAAVMTLGLLGCNGEDEAVVPEPAAPQSTAPPARQTTPPQAPVDGAGASGAAAPSAEPRDAAAPTDGSEPAPQRDTTPPPTERTPPPTPQPQPSAAPAQAPAQRQPSGGAPANDPQAQARELIDQVQVHATNMTWKEADQALAKLKTLRGKVPEELRVDIDNAESFLKAQKAINNVKGS